MRNENKETNQGKKAIGESMGSSMLVIDAAHHAEALIDGLILDRLDLRSEIGRASCRERV